MSIMLPKHVDTTNEHHHYSFLIESANADIWVGMEDYIELLVTHESLHAVLNFHVGHEAAMKLDHLPFADRFCITD